MKVLKFQVNGLESEIKLEHYLRTRYYFPYSVIKRMKTYNDSALLNGEPVLMIHKIRNGDEIVINYRADELKNPFSPVNLVIKIVFENDNYIVIDKPAKIPVLPNVHSNNVSIANFISYYLNGASFHPVNRLDKGTSGLMVIAKDSLSHAVLHSQLHTNRFVREYLALVVGNITPLQNKIELPIGRDDVSIIKRVVSENGKNAITNYDCIKQNEKYSLLKILLETGRTHQIRVHLSSMGYPIVGDWLYGKEDLSIIDRTALHSTRLEFFDVFEQRTISLESKLPDDIKNLI